MPALFSHPGNRAFPPQPALAAALKLFIRGGSPTTFLTATVLHAEGLSPGPPLLPSPIAESVQENTLSTVVRQSDRCLMKRFL